MEDAKKTARRKRGYPTPVTCPACGHEDEGWGEGAPHVPLGDCVKYLGELTRELAQEVREMKEAGWKLESRLRENGVPV